LAEVGQHVHLVLLRVDAHRLNQVGRLHVGRLIRDLHLHLALALQWGALIDV
jgi:hypothetical protein